jgi:hypothetical protein
VEWKTSAVFHGFQANGRSIGAEPSRATWTLADVFQASFSTDAAGRINPTEFRIDVVHGLPSDR